APVALPWYEDGSVWEGGDMWARADETRDSLIALYRTAWAHSDESIERVPLDAPAEVAWWSQERRHTTFGSILVRVVAETAHHAGHCDILRESVDGRSASDDGGIDASTWTAYVEQV